MENRFEIEFTEDGWQLNDYNTGVYLQCDTRKEANQLKNFAEAYVQKHGDIDLNEFPRDLDTRSTSCAKCKCGNHYGSHLTVQNILGHIHPDSLNTSLATRYHAVKTVDAAVLLLGDISRSVMITEVK